MLILHPLYVLLSVDLCVHAVFKAGVCECSCVVMHRGQMGWCFADRKGQMLMQSDDCDKGAAGPKRQTFKWSLGKSRASFMFS